MNLLEIQLFTNKFEQTAEFYRDVLVFEVASESSDSISFQAGSSLLTFLRAKAPVSEYHFAFNVPNNKIDECLTWINDKASVILNADQSPITDFGNWNAKALYFYDNNHNIVEFITRYDLQELDDRHFSASSISRISEIGIVTDTPLVYAEDIRLTYDVPVFAKGPAREDFVALGDNYGLLIISSAGRNWYPTQRMAVKNPVVVKMRMDNLIRTLTTID